MTTTIQLIQELGKASVDFIEVGFPYSDPIADGPVIQASYTRALDRHFHLDDLFAGIASLNHEELPPLVAMVSYAIVFKKGIETFLEKAKESGFSGLIVPDLPGDEASQLYQATESANLDLIQLVAPTTPPERAERILESASGFLYCISVSGTTGERAELPAELTSQLQWLRTKTKLPLAVGFGISQPEHVASLKEVADGIIVGSAIVRRMEVLTEHPDQTETVIQDVCAFAREMLQATRTS